MCSHPHDKVSLPSRLRAGEVFVTKLLSTINEIENIAEIKMRNGEYSSWHSSVGGEIE